VDVSPEIAFRHVEQTEALRRIIDEGIESLDKAHPRLVSCRVMVEESSRGIPHVRLDIGVPGDEVVIVREATDNPIPRDLPATLREAFDVARRQLREHTKKRVEGKRREPVAAPVPPLGDDEQG
jgi:ribosome-associated translation inhibitor RaiA